MKLLLAGEGADDLGGWAHEPAYREKAPELGVVEALLKRVRPDGWEVADAVRWKDIKKYRVGKGMHGAGRRNVLGLALRADEAGIPIVAFVRDRDRDEERASAIAEAMEESGAIFPNVEVIGGAAIEEIDAWLLAIRGRKRSESLGDPKAELRGKHGITDAPKKAELVMDAALSDIADDAESLRAWLDRARDVLTPAR